MKTVKSPEFLTIVENPKSKVEGIARGRIAPSDAKEGKFKRATKAPERAEKDLKRLQVQLAKRTCSGSDSAPTKPSFLDEKGLAARWATSVKHVQNIRYRGDGPLVTYFGRSVRYHIRDVVRFEKLNAFSSAAARDVSRLSKP